MDRADEMQRDFRASPDSWIGATLLALVVFAGVWPTLGWLEFSSGSENLNAATVLEIRRGGPLLVPTLNGRPRLAKPPLTVWISNLFVHDSTIRALDSSDRAQRDAAYRALGVQLRWPALLVGCGMLLATYALGRAAHSRQAGLLAMAVAGATLLLLRYSRSATTDVQLALWVAIANALLAAVVLRSAGSIALFLAAGLSIGLALMSKGPVALAQTILPLIAFLVWDRVKPINPPATPPRARHWLAALGVSFLIALPWPLYVLMHHPDALALWRSEITREGATTLAPDPWYVYASLFVLMIPWLGYFVAGLLVALKYAPQDRAARLILCLLIVPLIVMSLAKDKNERYLLPILPAAAMLVTFALLEQLKSPRPNWIERSLQIIHWTVLLALTIGLPLAGRWGGRLTRVDGTPWFETNHAIAFACIGAAFWSACVIAGRTGIVATAIGTLVLMLFINGVFVRGYADGPDGRSEMKPIVDRILAAHPSAAVWYYDPRPNFKPMPQDLSIYLNRLVPWATNVSQLPTDSAQQVLVLLQRENENPPSIPGWTPIASEPWGRRHWWAFVRQLP